MFLEEHNVLRSMRSGFCVYDSRGVDLNRMREGLEEISSWMSDGVRHYQPCSRTEDNAATIPQIGCQLSSARFTPRPVNCAVLVVNLAETAGAFKKGDLKPLQAIRDLFRCPAIRKSSNPLFLSIYFSLDSRELGLNSCRPCQTCRRKPPSDTHPRRHVIGGGENRRPAEALRVSGCTGGDGCI